MEYNSVIGGKCVVKMSLEQLFSSSSLLPETKERYLCFAVLARRPQLYRMGIDAGLRVALESRCPTLRRGITLKNTLYPQELRKFRPNYSTEWPRHREGDVGPIWVSLCRLGDGAGQSVRAPATGRVAGYGEGEGWEEGRREGEGERRLIGLEKETEIKLGLEREEVSCTGRRGRRNK